MDETAAQISRTLGPLRRAALQATRAATGLPDLPEAHVEALRVLAADGPLTSAVLANRLRLARSTVSNLIKAMSAEGLINREIAGDDLRSVVVRPSAHAEEQLRRYDIASTHVVSRALLELSQRDRKTITAAAPVLARLVDVLVAQTHDSVSRSV